MAVPGQALDLARRLEVPVQGIFVPAGASEEHNHSASPGGPLSQPRNRLSSHGAGISTTIEEIAHGYAAACARVKVPWQLSFWDGQSVAGLCERTKPTDLLTFGQTLPPNLKKELLRAARRPGFPPLLACSPAAPRVSRVLVVDRVDGSEERSFLAAAIALCHRLHAHPIVLTVARSERAAQARQQAGREVVAACGLDADFDFIVGTEVRTAVARVARWRRCPLVILGRHGSTPWLRWWRAPDAWPVDFTEFFSLLTLPGTGVVFNSSPGPTPGLPPGSLTNQGLFPVAWSGDRSTTDSHQKAGRRT